MMLDKISISASFDNTESINKIHNNLELYISLYLDKYKDKILETVEPRVDKGEHIYYFELEFPKELPNKYFLNIIKIIKGCDIHKLA